MVSKFQRSDIDIQKAVNAWCHDPAKATAANGTSLVTNMTELFDWKGKFNDDIIKWNVSNVTDMSWIFINIRFNDDISGWDVT